MKEIRPEPNGRHSRRRIMTKNYVLEIRVNDNGNYFEEIEVQEHEVLEEIATKELHAFYLSENYDKIKAWKSDLEIVVYDKASYDTDEPEAVLCFTIDQANDIYYCEIIEEMKNEFDIQDESYLHSWFVETWVLDEDIQSYIDEYQQMLDNEES